MALYRIDELLAAAKAIARGAVSGVGTEAGSDLDLTINAAARMLQGAQVAGAHVLEQLAPASADAERRDQLVDMLGLSFARAATPARGLIAVLPAVLSGDPDDSFTLPAGTEIPFPGELFADGAERVYRTLSDVVYVLAPHTMQFVSGTGIWKLFPKGGLSWPRPRMVLGLRSGVGPSSDSQYAFVRGVNADEQSVDLITPVRGAISLDPNNMVIFSVTDVLVEAECVTPGATGNAPHTFYQFLSKTTDVAERTLFVNLVEMSGGGDEVSEIDGNTERVVRLLEDTLAMPPGYGNAQHWREIALSCPDVDLDDALVYQHVRGPGTIDIVCIGRSGSVRSSAFPNVNASFCGWGNNQRRIGDAQAARVRAWCRSHAAYFDDVEVRSVEWDWRGNTYVDNTFSAFLQAAGGVVLTIEAQDGYGPDCGVALDVTPNQRHASRLYAAVLDAQIDASLQVGQRVWATVGHSTSDVRHAFATVVTTILSIAGDRTYAEIADVSVIGQEEVAVLRVLRWGSAGPLTQACVDTVFAYYDALGPGTYLEPPRSSMYVQYFSNAISPVALGHAVTRWPPEGRRWSASLRSSELRAQLLTIEGVRDVALSPSGNLSGLLDFDPAVFQTLACAGVVPRSA